MEETRENISTEGENPINTVREGENEVTADSREAGKALAKLGAAKGGRARAERLTPEARSEQARKAVSARWAKRGVKAIPVTKTRGDGSIEHYSVPGLPLAEYKGFLNIMDVDLPCYVLSTGQRVIGRVAATEMLSGFKYQGDLEGYIRSQNLKPYINKDSVVERMVSFRLPEVEQLGREAKGLPADLMIEVCSGLVKALEASHSGQVKLTPRQVSMAIKSSMFLTA